MQRFQQQAAECKVAAVCHSPRRKTTGLIPESVAGQFEKESFQIWFVGANRTNTQRMFGKRRQKACEFSIKS